jgi:hypothetical protein
MAVVKAETLVDLACRLGVVEDNSEGRRAYRSWLRRDPNAAQRPVWAAVDERPGRSHATKGSAGTARAVTGRTPTEEFAYPDSWKSASVMRPAGVRAASSPGGRRAAAVSRDRSRVTSGSATTAQVVEANRRAGLGGQEASRSRVDVAAAGDNPRRLASLREAEFARMEREVWKRR